MLSVADLLTIAIAVGAALAAVWLLASVDEDAL